MTPSCNRWGPCIRKHLLCSARTYGPINDVKEL